MEKEETEEQPLHSLAEPSEDSASDAKRQKRADIGEPVCDYALRLSSVTGLEERWNENCCSLPELLRLNCNQLQSSAQFNFMIDPNWLMSCYPEECRRLPLLLVTSRNSSSWSDLTSLANRRPNVRLVDARLPIPYGSHHTKLMIFKYQSGIRFVIHTANLIENDWYQKTQGLYVSPIHPPLKGNGAGDSSTHFKADILSYLNAYGNKEVKKWHDLIAKHDLSKARVYVVASVPGRHNGAAMAKWGHLRLGRLLSTNLKVEEVAPTWPVVCQFSSIGSLGSTADKWLFGEFASSLGSVKSRQQLQNAAPNNIRLIYPCVNDVRCSLEGYGGGGSLPYSNKTAAKQHWLDAYLHRWRSECRGRTLACPHIKTYLRCDPTYQRMAWFLITSANLSKAAWGCFEKNNTQLTMRSYELGVLFLPHHFNQNTFELRTDGASSAFPIPYDLPPVPYGPKGEQVPIKELILMRFLSLDTPWIVDVSYQEEPDSHGEFWTL